MLKTHGVGRGFVLASGLGWAVLFSVSLILPSEGFGNSVSRGEAKMIALERAVSSSNLVSVGGWTSKCQPNGKSRFRCIVKVRGQTEWRLTDCRFVVRVAKQGRTRLTSKGCSALDVPFLTDAIARKTALALVDSEYASSSNEVWSEGFGRESNTRIQFLFSWTTAKENCLQEVRVELVDGMARGTSGAKVCVPRPEWPGDSIRVGD